MLRKLLTVRAVPSRCHSLYMFCIIVRFFPETVFSTSVMPRSKSYFRDQRVLRILVPTLPQVATGHVFVKGSEMQLVFIGALSTSWLCSHVKAWPYRFFEHVRLRLCCRFVFVIVHC